MQFTSSITSLFSNPSTTVVADYIYMPPDALHRDWYMTFPSLLIIIPLAALYVACFGTIIDNLKTNKKWKETSLGEKLTLPGVPLAAFAFMMNIKFIAPYMIGETLSMQNVVNGTLYPTGFFAIICVLLLSFKSLRNEVPKGPVNMYLD